jgi:hypothetical protein
VHNEGRVLGTGTGIRQAAAYSLIQGFLETLPSLLHGITQQLLYIRIESNGGTHDLCIMSTAGLAVKMPELSKAKRNHSVLAGQFHPGSH